MHDFFLGFRKNGMQTNHFCSFTPHSLYYLNNGSIVLHWSIFLDLHNSTYVYESILLRAYYIKIIFRLYFGFSGFPSVCKKDVDNHML